MWLLTAEALQTLETAYNSGFTPSAEQVAKFEARFSGGLGGGESHVLKITGDQAEISVNGILTKNPDIMAMIFGGGNTTYGEVITAINTAEGDKTVKNISMSVSSPGGEFDDSMFDLMAAMQGAKKPISTVASGTAASAAYGILSQGGNVTAKSPATMLGSIGVAASIRTQENRIEIASTEAPKKRPDLKTVEGVAVIKEQLDAMHELFADAIATGRNTTVENVNATFGRGATLLAGDALNRGMIDGIVDAQAGPGNETATDPQQTTALGGNLKEGVRMSIEALDLATLKAQHPAVFEAAKAEGVGIGTAQERDRVSAHLIMGTASGDLETAHASIQDGSEMTAVITAKYNAAQMNRQDIEARNGDDGDLAGADGADGSGGTAEASEQSNIVAAEIEKRFSDGGA